MGWDALTTHEVDLLRGANIFQRWLNPDSKWADIARAQAHLTWHYAVRGKARKHADALKAVSIAICEDYGGLRDCRQSGLLSMDDMAALAAGKPLDVPRGDSRRPSVPDQSMGRPEEWDATGPEVGPPPRSKPSLAGGTTTRGPDQGEQGEQGEQDGQGEQGEQGGQLWSVTPAAGAAGVALAAALAAWKYK